MNKSQAASPSQASVSRRDFLRGSAAAAALPALRGAAQADASASRKTKPNIVVYIADQFRWDCVSAYGLNPMQVTPNLDGVAARGTAFQNAVTNQPL
ncbi:MAG: twin-arginine translocation signal domain-containing protein, partial [Acidobacteriota bacterium]